MDVRLARVLGIGSPKGWRRTLNGSDTCLQHRLEIPAVFDPGGRELVLKWIGSRSAILLDPSARSTPGPAGVRLLPDQPELHLHMIGHQPDLFQNMAIAIAPCFWVMGQFHLTSHVVLPAPGVLAHLLCDGRLSFARCHG